MVTRVFVKHAVAATALVLFLGQSGAKAVPAPAWPQAASDISPDPDVKFGTLASGFHYIIMRNVTPPGQVSIRLRMGVGSLEESEAQRGLAHFLEHMAFRGSNHVADGDVVKILARLGLRFGADTNASTGQTETVFQFDLPKSDEETLDTGLMLTREIVSELSLNAQSFDSERGIVLSEERLRDGPGARAYEAEDKFLLKGQLAPERLPIGKVDVIRNAPVSQISDFYHAYYRPERATLIVVGDIDPAALDAKIKARFADWTPAGAGRPDPDLGTPAKRGDEAMVFSEAGAPRAVSASWLTDYDSSPDTIAHRKKDRIERIGLAIINQRFARAAENPDAPFLGAGVSHGNDVRSAKIASLSVSYAGDDWRKGLAAADTIRREAIAFGVTQDEVDREVTSELARARAVVAASATRNTPALAGALAASIDRDTVFSTPAENLAEAEAALKDLKADTVNAALKTVFTGNGPLVFLSGPTPVAGGDTALLAAFNAAESAPIANIAEAHLAAWPYVNFGTPGAVVENRTLDDLDTHLIRFANGVRLTVKSTKFRADQVLVLVDLAGGRLKLPKDRPTFNTGAYIGGGLAAMDFFDLRRELSDKIYNVGFGIDDDSFSLSGNTRREDLDTQLEVLAAYLTAPGWRAEAYQQGLTAIGNGLAQRDTNPMALFGAKLPALLHGGDIRWASVENADLKKARLEDLKAPLEAAFKNAPIEITIVGDITPQEAIAKVAASFGALPPRSDAPGLNAAAGEVRFPAANATPLVLTHDGRADQGIAFIAWPTTDVFANSESPARRILTDVLQLRLTEQLRMQDGATYSPGATAAASETFPGYGYIAAYAEIPPEKTKLFYDTVAGIAADLREHGPSADEMERARKPEVDALERSTQTNAYWLSALAGVQSDERRLTLVRNALPGLMNTTAADVQNVAREYLTDAKSWKLVVTPKAAAQP